MAFSIITVTPQPIYSKDVDPSRDIASGDRFLLGKPKDLEHYCVLLMVQLASPDGTSWCCFDGSKWAKEMLK